MILIQAEVDRGAEETEARRANSEDETGSAPTPFKVALLDERRTQGSRSEPAGVVGRTTSFAVIFRMPDGSCEEGTACHVGGEVIFIESKRGISIGTEVTIRLTQPNDDVADWGVAAGAVVWTCPTMDQFKNREGFGVCLQERWPQSPHATEAEGPAERVGGPQFVGSQACRPAII